MDRHGSFSGMRRHVLLWGCIGILACAPASADDVFTISAIGGSPTTVLARRILEKAYSDLGIKIDVQELPGKRALQYSSTGKVDAESHRMGGLGEVYPDLIQIPIPIIQLDVVVFSRRRDFVLDGWTSLAGHKLGARRGIVTIEEALRGMDVELTNGWASLFHMLDKDRIEMAVALRFSGLIFLREEGIEGVHIIEPTLEVSNLYHYVHRKHASKVRDITQAIGRLVASGEIARMKEEILRGQVNWKTD